MRSSRPRSIAVAVAVATVLLVAAAPGDEPSPGTPPAAPVTVATEDDTGTDVCPNGSYSVLRFTDVTPYSTHGRAVSCAAWWGVVNGVGGARYEPHGDLTRAQTASLIARMIERTSTVLPQPAPHGFDDVSGSVHEAAIGLLAQLDVISGTHADAFSPASPVSRGQLASMLVRTHETVFDLRLPEEPTSFVDIAGVHERSIAKLATAGIVAGRSATHFDPGGVVTREQMATFLTRYLRVLVSEGLLDLPAAGPAIDGEPLRSVLADSVALRSVPATLDPSLGDAGGVLPRIYADGCVGAESNFDDCVYGDVGAQRTVVLFGDSHAAHWFPPLEDLAVRNGWRLVAITRGGCPTIDVERFYDGVAADDCYRWRDEQVARIIAEQPELLVLSNSAVYDAYDADGQVEDDRKVANLVEGQARTVARLRTGSPATAITVIGASPRLSYEAPVCLADNLTSVGACETDRDALTVDGLVAAQRAQADADGVGFLDPTGLLCTATHCPLIIGDLLVYWDTHHLSPPLTMWLRPALDDALFAG